MPYNYVSVLHAPTFLPASPASEDEAEDEDEDEGSRIDG